MASKGPAAEFFEQHKGEKFGVFFARFMNSLRVLLVEYAKLPEGKSSMDVQPRLEAETREAKLAGVAENLGMDWETFKKIREEMWGAISKVCPDLPLPF